MQHQSLSPFLKALRQKKEVVTGSLGDKLGSRSHPVERRVSLRVLVLYDRLVEDDPGRLARPATRMQNQSTCFNQMLSVRSNIDTYQRFLITLD